MPDHPRWGRSHPISQSEIRDLCLDLYILMVADFGSSQSLVNTIADHTQENKRIPSLKNNYPLHFYLQNAFDKRFSDLLISIAIRFRIYDDLIRISSHKDTHEDIIKTLEPNDDLSLRDVCNKIIHANGLQIQWESADNAWTRIPQKYRSSVISMTGLFKVSGRQGKVEWEYIISAYQLIDDVFKVVRFNT